MSSARADIREAVVAVLKAAGTAAGQDVFDHPSRPRTQFPALVVEDAGAAFSDGGVTETQGPATLPGDLMRAYRFVVIAEVKQGDTAPRQRDELIGEVESALIAAFDAKQLPGVLQLELRAYQANDNNFGELPSRRGMQMFEATYVTARGAPGTTL